MKCRIATLRSMCSYQRQILFFVAVFVTILFMHVLLPTYSTSHEVLLPPSGKHWLGTNDIGQDVLTGIITATPTTVTIALITALLSLSISIFAAAIAAISGPALRNCVLRIVDILLVIPSILILLLFAAWLQPNLIGMTCLLALATWHEDVRVLYAIILRERSRENVLYVRRVGGSWRYVIWHHILPAIAPTLSSLYIQKIRQTALKAAGLAFLGLTDPRLVSWGSMMQDALEYLYTPAAVWLLLPPALSLTIFLLFVLLFGRAVEQHVMNDGRWSEHSD